MLKEVSYLCPRYMMNENNDNMEDDGYGDDGHTYKSRFGSY